MWIDEFVCYQRNTVRFVSWAMYAYVCTEISRSLYAATFLNRFMNSSLKFIIKTMKLSALILTLFSSK